MSTQDSAKKISLCEAFQARVAEMPDAVALRTPGDTVSITWREYDRRVRAIAAGLSRIGVRRGDTVALMMTNRPEFHLCDSAALHLGATPFSVYNTSAPEQIRYLFDNAGNRVVLTEKQFVPRIREVGGKVEHIISVDGEAAGATTLADLEADPDPDFDFDAAWRAVEPDDLATIIYTSGTTGPPKGVELTHHNITVEAKALEDMFRLESGWRILSYLPAAHIADRVTSHYSMMLFGAETTCLDDPRKLAEGLPDTRPHLFFGVPRVWEKFKSAIDTALAAERSPAKRAIADWAIGVGAKVARLKLADRSVPPLLGVQHRLADTLVLAKLRHKLGLDRAKICASGAAPISAKTLEYFWGLGIPLYEVWGMSETSGLSTTTAPGRVKIGTVGQAVPGIEVKLAEDGELLVKGPTLMRGYRNDPEKTAETIDADGWLHTGDVATIDDDGYVTIVDRKKELIINEAGKNMSPANIENTIKASCSVLGPVVAIGDARPYVSALLVLDPDAASALAAQYGLEDASPAELAAHPAVREAVTAGVRAGNEQLSRVEQIKRFRILPTVWEPGGDELTPTLKLRRKPIAEKYQHEIDEMYGKTAGGDTIDLSS
ncbi:MAG TPA: long-chain fatty acid--CoA ligase [Actinophytocola sp.]|uniref:AMP-dependent synthetase/ligase n=1 Tax=Actinophytocola sp. TaxID=1872138 RepID=UPI002DDCDD2F|nr:long-chain fatty acid--CoA ligase [Actinophytocola sp.]HEV2781945.1 long-chain fatty acid--CoA ligase [Actinophytocola sp.]